MANDLLSVEFALDVDVDAYVQDVGEKALLSGVAAAAKVFYDEVKLNVSGARGHPKIVTGNLNESIYRAYSPERSSFTVKTYRISWNKSKAPHGHLIEFGTSRAPAYPFLRPAFDRASAAGEAGLAAIREALAGNAPQ